MWYFKVEKNRHLRSTDTFTLDQRINLSTKNLSSGGLKPVVTVLVTEYLVRHMLKPLAIIFITLAVSGFETEQVYAVIYMNNKERRLL